MRVLVTRPADDAVATARLLAAAGHSCLIDPVLDIRFRDSGTPDLDDVQALLATSRNGVRALARATPRRDIPLCAVGRSTAALARESGFGRVEDADGDVADLVAMVGRLFRPGDGALYHAAGSELAGDLSGDLRRQGFTVQREVLYHAEAARTLLPATRDALDAGRIDAVLFFSPRSAQGFVSLVTEAGLEHRCSRLLACCISERAATAARALPFRTVRTAAAPNQDALLALLDDRPEKGDRGPDD
ncbi:MAG: uroporphyrinogen-III synthase [Pseudomonadota bacterium]|nr:uroporphyrinogen-III synthase [Pseudomonadota bacterium]